MSDHKRGYVLGPESSRTVFESEGGGKALNLFRLSQANFNVPTWICLSSKALDEFLSLNAIQTIVEANGDNFIDVERAIEELFLSNVIPISIREELMVELERRGLLGCFVAVRSSGLDEDSADHSFAGQFSSFLFQRGADAIIRSVLRCWASGWSARALAYRKERGLSLSGIRIGVIIQRMIDSEIAGVTFSRTPIDPADRNRMLISSVWGQGEGLVSGQLDSDEFSVHRKSFDIEEKVSLKEHELRSAAGGGLRQCALTVEKRSCASLAHHQVKILARLALDIEVRFGRPQDIEWCIEGGTIFVLQTRPITSLPPDALFDEKCVGKDSILWDNSNIVESFSGVTTPLTFSHVSRCYQEVYYQFCRLMQVPQDVIQANEAVFRNMLGLVRGRIYYNLANWYHLLYLFPGTAQSKSFMETMMGVKQGLKPEIASLFDFTSAPVQYSVFSRLRLFVSVTARLLFIDGLISSFEKRVDAIVAEGRHKNFSRMSLQELVSYYHYLTERVLKYWQAPIVNDTRCMVFFGLLKALTSRWFGESDTTATLQNDLLCGQGDLESTEPTRMLMRIASEIDNGPENRRSWFLSQSSQAIWGQLVEGGVFPELYLRFKEFLDLYGFRCVNELKLEEPDLHDDPSFALEAVASYVRMKSYSVAAMEAREREIRTAAEKRVAEKFSGLLGGVRRIFFNFVLRHARRAVRDRENLRFDRTKTFGIVRHLFRGFGNNFVQLGVLDHHADVFYLTIDEIIGYIEGRGVSLNLRQVAQVRRAEFDDFRKLPSPPDRFTTRGAAGAIFDWPQILDAEDLLRQDGETPADPNLLMGTACCPGVVEGVVRVVHSMSDAMGLSGEILVTERTDPGWVPLYPACSGLLIERGSLLSHSAVVARELGLPTIVGIKGGLVQRLKTGMRVRMDAARGEVRILQDGTEAESELVG